MKKLQILVTLIGACICASCSNGDVTMVATQEHMHQAYWDKNYLRAVDSSILGFDCSQYI